MTVLHSGTTIKYSANWSKAFKAGGKSASKPVAKVATTKPTTTKKKATNKAGKK